MSPAKMAVIILLFLVVCVMAGCMEKNTGSSPVMMPGTTTTAPLTPERVVTPPEKHLDVPLIYSGYNGNPGLCHLGAYAMAAASESPDLDFSDIIAASGAGTMAKYWGRDFISNGVGETGMIYASDNLGFDYVLGLGPGGTDSDYNLPYEYRVKDQAHYVEHIADEDDALSFLKQAVSSGHPLVVHADMFYLKDALAGQNTFWSDIPKMHGSHFVVVTGYDDQNIYVSDPIAEGGKDLRIPVSSFVDAWYAPVEFERNNLGPYWSTYLEKTGSRKGYDEILAFNKKMSTAPDEIRKFAESGVITEFSCFNFDELAEGRARFADYLRRNGNEAAAVSYGEISSLYGTVCTDPDRKGALLRISGLEKEALGRL